jgi:hypothetical protein
VGESCALDVADGVEADLGAAAIVGHREAIAADAHDLA